MIIKNINGINTLTKVEKADIKEGVLCIAKEISVIDEFACSQNEDLISEDLINVDLIEIVFLSSELTINAFAFESCSKLKNIIFPAHLTKIHISEGALSYCTSIKRFKTPKGLTIIKSDTFYGCESLEEVIISNDVHTIEDCAFYNCENLISLTVTNSLKTIGNSAFYGCNKFLRIIIDVDDEQEFQRVKALFPEELRHFAIKKNFYSLLIKTQLKLVMEAPSSIFVQFNYLYEFPDDLLSEISFFSVPIKHMEKIPFPQNKTELNNYEQSIKNKVLQRIVANELETYSKLLKNSDIHHFFSSYKKPSTENNKTIIATYELISKMIPRLKREKTIILSEDEYSLLQKRPVLLSKITKLLDNGLMVIQSSANHIKAP